MYVGMHNKNVRRNWGSRTSHFWQARQSRSAEAELQTVGSPGRDEMWKWTYPYLEVLTEQVRKMNEVFRSPGRADVQKLNFISLAVKAEQKCGRRTSHLLKSQQRWNAEVDLPILGSPGRTSVKDERELSKSRPSGSMEDWTSDLWQSRQSRSAEAELHILGSPGRDEMRKWTYPYLEVLAEQVRKMNEIFRSPGRVELVKAELQIFGSKDIAELRKRNFRPLKVLAELKCRSWTSDPWQPRQDRSAEAELHILRRIGRAEVRNGFHVTSLVVRPNGSAGVEFQIFGSPAKLEVWKQNFTSLTGHYPTDCHCQCWRILTAIIVIPSEGQCEDQVWLKHRTFAMLLTRSLCSRRDSA